MDSQFVVKKDTTISDRQKQFLLAHHKHHHFISLTRLLLLIIFLGAWEVSAGMGWIDTFFFSSPSGIIRFLYQMFLDHFFFQHTGITLL